MITQEDYRKAQKTVNEYKLQQLNLPIVVQQSELLLCGVCDEETKHDVTLREELHCLKCGNVAKE